MEGTAINEDHIVPDAGERKVGWQLKASNACEELALETLLSMVPRPSMPLNVVNAFKVRLRSCGGERTSQWLTTLPTSTNLVLNDCEFKCSIFRRLGLPIEVLQDECEGCGKNLDREGHHRATCMRTGRVQLRHKPFVKIWVQILREAIVRVFDKNIERTLNTTHINRGGNDLRRMDIITSGISGVMRGTPLFMDATIISPLRGDGSPVPNAVKKDGAALFAASIKNRETDYPDVEYSLGATLLCLGSPGPIGGFGHWCL